jgi:hypothetical protein
LIHLTDYTPSVLKFIKAQQYACVYVFAIDGHKPVKIGRALSLKHQLGLVQDATRRAGHHRARVLAPIRGNGGVDR